MSKQKSQGNEVLEALGLFFLAGIFVGLVVALIALCGYLWGSFWDWSNAAWVKLNEDTRIEIVNNIPKANCLEADVVYHVYRGPNISNDDVDDVVLASGGME